MLNKTFTTAIALLALSGSAYALNPQPEPPGVASHKLNPQPEPPGVHDNRIILQKPTEAAGSDSGSEAKKLHSNIKPTWAAGSDSKDGSENKKSSGLGGASKNPSKAGAIDSSGSK